MILMLIYSFQILAERNYKMALDLGVSAGSDDDESFYELNLGVNTYFFHLLNFRNAFFYRSYSESSTLLGLDTSIQLDVIHELSKYSSINLFLGPGYRFQSRDKGAPFVELGTIFRGSFLALGFRYKRIMRKMVDDEDKDENLLTIIIAARATI